MRLHNTTRNLWLLSQSACQHLRDDPALLAIQVSRRLPLSARTRAGRALRAIGAALPNGAGVVALGSVMAGSADGAIDVLESAEPRASRLHGEVAVLVGRTDLVSTNAPPSTRARAAWANGDLRAAVSILTTAGHGDSRQARRLRSELGLLTGDCALTVRYPASSSTGARGGGEDPIRILHLITNSLPHTQSGYSLRTHNILTGLARHGIESVALTRTGYPVMVGKPFADDEDVVDGIRYVRTLPHSLGDTLEERLEQEVDQALQIVRVFRPHVLHATTDYRNALVAQAVSAATGIPWVFEVRGLMEQTWIASHRSQASRDTASRSEKVRLLAGREGALAQDAAAVVTLSRSMAAQLESRGVDPSRITLVPNGVDEELLFEQLSTSAARQALGLEEPPTAFFIGAVSALVDYEGFDVLLRSAARIIGDVTLPTRLREGLQVVLVGDGVSAPGLRDLAEELGIADRVRTPGRVSRDQARIWVQALDIVTVPRRDREVSRTVTPQKPVEALALGRPVIVSDLPALRETIRDEEGLLHGRLAQPDSESDLARVIAELAQDPGARRRLATSGRSLAAGRTWSAMMQRYESVYRTVLTQ